MFKRALAKPSFVGREKEIAELVQALNLAVEGKGNTVFVSGEAGSGKSRLTNEFLEIVKNKGAVIMAGSCLSDVASPYFPFVEAFNNYLKEAKETQPDLHNQSRANSNLRTEEAGIAAWLIGTEVPSRSEKPENTSPQIWKDQIFAGVAKKLSTISAEQPVVLFLEDVHWADSASLALLHYLSRAIVGSESVLLLATYRSEELTTDSEGYSHPLSETLRIMRREELITEIKLQNLDKKSVSKIAENMIGGNLEPKLTEKLIVESRGNPLFVVESIRMLHERKSLFEENNRWRLAVDELGIPSKIKDIILRRLAGLKYNQRRILDAAAVIGEKFDVEQLAGVLSLDGLEALETLNLIANATSLVTPQGNFYRFDHAKSREVIYEELSSPLKRGYHERIGEKLENSDRASILLSDLAFHFSQSGNEKKAIKYSLAAGQDELSRFSNSESANHFKFVVESTEGKVEYKKESEMALEGLGDALFADSMFKEAMKAFETLADGTEIGTLKLRALRKAMDSAFESGNAVHLSDLVKKAEPYAALDRLESARVLMERGRVYASYNKGREALSDFEEALRVFEEEYSPEDVAWALIGVGERHPGQGKPKEGTAEILRMVALCEELGNLNRVENAYHCRIFTFNMVLLEPEALEAMEKLVNFEDKMKIGSYADLVYGYAFAVRSYVQRGFFEEALPHALKALELSKKTDSDTAKGVAYSTLTQLYARSGKIERSEEIFGELMKLPSEILLHPFVRGVFTKAVFFAGKGQWEESNREFKEMFELFKIRNPGAWGNLISSTLYYAWALEKQGRIQEAKMQLEEARKIRDEAQTLFEQADVRAFLMVRRQVVAGEETEMRIDLVNVGRRQSILMGINNLVAPEFNILCCPTFCSMQVTNLRFMNKALGPFQVETIKLRLKIEKAGTYTLNPELFYNDDLGNSKTSMLAPITITVKPAKPAFEVLPGRVATGTFELDRLLMGGIPENYAVVLKAVSSDERQQMIKSFIEQGLENGQTTILLTCEAGGAEQLAKAVTTYFYIVLCNPQAEFALPSLPNVIKLKGIESLTEIDIAITKLLRNINLAQNQHRRACIELISDVLLQHHAVTTRKWLTGLITTLKSKGFTTMAAIDPLICPEEVPAITSLFEGEIRIAEKETENGTTRTLRVLKLQGQVYLKDEVSLS